MTSCQPFLLPKREQFSAALHGLVGDVRPAMFTRSRAAADIGVKRWPSWVFSSSVTCYWGLRSLV